MSDESRFTRANKILIAGYVIVAIVAGTWRLGMWEGASPTERAAQTSADGDFTSGLTVYPATARPDVPSLAGTTLEGEQLDLADLLGHVVVLNVWGSWCTPCREEAPDLAKVSRETFADGVRFLGIDTRDDDDAARAFVRSFGITYPSLIDKEGNMLLPFSQEVPVSAVPSTLIITPDGKIAAKVVGRIEYSTLTGLLDDVLAETDEGQARRPKRQP